MAWRKHRTEPELTPRKEMTGTLYDVIQGNGDGDSAWIKSGENLYRENGKVGIGITEPQAPLDVFGPIRLSGDGRSETLIFRYGGESGAPTIDSFRLRYENDFFATNHDALIIEKTDGNGNSPDGGIAFVNTGQTGEVVPSLSIRGNGNVGVATIDPRERLEINGLIRIPVASNADNNSPGIIAASNDDFLYDGQYINHYGFGFHNFNDGSGYHGVNAYIAGYYGIDFFTGGQNRLRISNNGNVHVHKTLKAREIVVDTKKWYDVVFEDNYELMPLNEVEQHIKTHKHLPEIPSEREVLENGVSVGEMQARLLQKVEELTLHLIDQDKKLTALQRENETLKEELSTLKHVR